MGVGEKANSTAPLSNYMLRKKVGEVARSRSLFANLTTLSIYSSPLHKN